MDAAQVAVGRSPIGGAYDPTTGYVYVANEAGYPSSNGTVSVLQNATVLATLPAGMTPILAFVDGKNDLVYVTNANSRDVTVISGTTVVATVPVGGAPQGGVVDPITGFAYILNSNSSSVSVLNGTIVVATLEVGTLPVYGAYDPADRDVYVANEGSGNVSVLRGTAVVGAIATGGYPGQPAYDTDTGTVFVPTSGPNVSVIQGTSVVDQLDIGAGPTYWATFDDVDRSVYVVEGGLPGTVVVLSNTTIVGHVSGLVGPYGAVVDEPSGEVYVPNQSDASVTVINGTALVATVLTGNYPWVAVPDPTDHQVDVVSYGADEVDILRWEAAYPINVTETGLPANTTWGVVVDGHPYDSAFAYDAFYLPNGTHGFTVEAPAGYSASPRTGNLSVTGASVNASMAFSELPPSFYSVDFSESGLPVGANWSVTLDANVQTTVGTSLIFEEVNGSYGYTIPEADGFDASPSYGTAVVAGAAVSIALNFSPAPVPLSVNFTSTYVSAGCWPSGAVTNDVNLAATAVGGTPPYAYSWLLPTGSAKGPTTNTTLTWPGNDSVTVGVTDTAGNYSIHTAVPTIFLPPCPSLGNVSHSEGSTNPPGWVWWTLVGSGGLAVLAVVATILYRRRTRPPDWAPEP